MRVCGVELKAADAVVVVLEGNKESFEIIDTGVQKITLSDTNSSVEVQAFHESFHAFVQKYQIDKIGIKKRNTKGRFAGGATTFKIEGIIQLAKDATAALIAPASIASTIKKSCRLQPTNFLRIKKVLTKQHILFCNHYKNVRSILRYS
jgi:hypothetical protein